MSIGPFGGGGTGNPATPAPPTSPPSSETEQRKQKPDVPTEPLAVAEKLAEVKRPEKVSLGVSKDRPAHGGVVIVSRYGELVPLASRIGATLYYPNEWYRRRGLYNGICSVADTLQDALRTRPSAVIFDHTGSGGCQVDDEPLGKVSDVLRARGVPTWGAGEVNDLLENNRAFFLAVALKCGLNIPRTLFFDPARGQPWTTVDLGGRERIFRVKGHLDEARAFVSAAGGKWVLKPCDTAAASLTFVADSDEEMERWIAHQQEVGGIDPTQRFLLQEHIKGPEVSSEWLVSYGEIVADPNGTIETKKAFGHDTGPAVGCATSVSWIYDDDKAMLVRRTIGRSEFREWLKKPIGPGGKEFPPYNAPIDINAIISEDDHECYVLEATPRAGFSGIYAHMVLMGGDLRKIFTDLAHGEAPDMNYRHREFGYSVRVQIPPSPYADKYIPPSGTTATERKANWAFAERLMEDATYVHIDGPVDDPNVWLTDAQAYPGGIRTAGVDGAVMEITARAEDAVECAEKAGCLFKEIDLPDAFGRIGKDGVKLFCRNSQQLLEWGYPIPGVERDDPEDRDVPEPRVPVFAAVTIRR